MSKSDVHFFLTEQVCRTIGVNFLPFHTPNDKQLENRLTRK